MPDFQRLMRLIVKHGLANSPPRLSLPVRLSGTQETPGFGSSEYNSGAIVAADFSNLRSRARTLAFLSHALGAGLQVSLVSPKKIADKPARKKDVAAIVSATDQENFPQVKGNEGTKQTVRPGRQIARRR